VLWAEWNIKGCLRSHRWVGQANFRTHMEEGGKWAEVKASIHSWIWEICSSLLVVFPSHVQGCSTHTVLNDFLIIFVSISGPYVLVNLSVEYGYLNYFINPVNIPNCNELSRSSIPETVEPARRAPANKRVWMYCSHFHQWKRLITVGKESSKWLSPPGKVGYFWMLWGG